MLTLPGRHVINSKFPGSLMPGPAALPAVACYCRIITLYRQIGTLTFGGSAHTMPHPSQVHEDGKRPARFVGSGRMRGFDVSLKYSARAQKDLDLYDTALPANEYGRLALG